MPKNLRRIPFDRLSQILEIMGDPAADTLSLDHAAILTAISGLAVNTRVKIAIPDKLEKPEAGNSDIKLWLLLYDETGHMEDADSLPTVAVENELGVDRSSNLRDAVGSSTTMTRVAEGVYWIYYRVADAASKEYLTFTCTVVETAVTRTFKVISEVVDEVDVEDKVDTILSDLQVPAKDSADNVLVRDALGNKTDTVAGTSVFSRLAGLLAAISIADADVLTQFYERDVIGNKNDTIAGNSIVALSKQLLALGSILNSNIGDPSARDNLKSLLALLGNPDEPTASIWNNLGSFHGQTNLNSLLAVLGSGWDTANKDLYTALITDRLDQASYGLSALRTLLVKLQSYSETGSTNLSDATETTVKEFLVGSYGLGLIKTFKIDLTSFNSNAAVGSILTLRVYEKIDSTNYRLITDDSVQYQYVQGITTPVVAEISNISFSDSMKITAQLSAVPTGTVALTYRTELSKNM